MIRLLHILAITGLIASAAYVYGIKYDTLYYSEEIAKLRTKLRREHDAIAVARAEWALMTSPDRLQRMTERMTDLAPMAVTQLARFSDLPARGAKNDEIGRKLEMLGLETAKEPAPAKDKRADAPAPPRTPAR